MCVQVREIHSSSTVIVFVCHHRSLSQRARTKPMDVSKQPTMTCPNRKHSSQAHLATNKPCVRSEKLNKNKTPNENRNLYLTLYWLWLSDSVYFSSLSHIRCLTFGSISCYLGRIASRIFHFFPSSSSFFSVSRVCTTATYFERCRQASDCDCFFSTHGTAETRNKFWCVCVRM